MGLNQTAMAELGGVKRNTQSIYETGERAPDAVYLARIAEHGANVAWIVTGEGEPCVSRDQSAALAPPSGRATVAAAHEGAASFDGPRRDAPGRLSNMEAELVHGYRALPDPDRAVVERVVTALKAALPA